MINIVSITSGSLSGLLMVYGYSHDVSFHTFTPAAPAVVKYKHTY